MSTVLDAVAAKDPYSLTSWAFDNAWLVATQKSATSDSLFSQAISSGGGAPTVMPATFSYVPNVVEPQVNIPQQAEGASVTKFYELSTAVINQLAQVFRDYMTTYFPDDQPYLQDAEAKIVQMLTTGGTGLNPAVEARIWDRERSRTLKEADRAEAEAMRSWAARRYPMPPGAAAHQILEIRKDAADKISQASRDIAIKQAEMELENVRFAIQQALALYGEASGAAMEYVKALSVGPQSGMQLIPSITDSQSKLITAANAYYESRIHVEELKMKARMPTVEWDQQARIKNADYKLEDRKLRVDAAVAAAQSMGTQAASALNSLHASANISGSGGTNVSYSYSNDTLTAAPTVTGV